MGVSESSRGGFVLNQAPSPPTVTPPKEPSGHPTQVASLARL